jgi:hypothetical protein
MRTLDTQLLKNYLSIHGKLAKETLAVQSKISFVKIERLLRGVKIATELEMDSLCRVTGYKKDELFPTLENKKEFQAS